MKHKSNYALQITIISNIKFLKLLIFWWFKAQHSNEVRYYNSICNYLGQAYSNIGIIHIKFHTKTYFCSDEMKPNTRCYLCAKRCLQWLCPHMLMIINHIFSLATIVKQISSNNKEVKNEKDAFDLDKCQIAFGYFFKIIFFHMYFL